MGCPQGVFVIQAGRTIMQAEYHTARSAEPFSVRYVIIRRKIPKWRIAMKHHRFLFVPDSFKGSLSSAEIIRILKEEAKAFFPDAECLCMPIADGGEGTLDAMLSAVGGDRRFVEATDPLLRPIRCCYGVIHKTDSALPSGFDRAGAGMTSNVPLRSGSGRFERDLDKIVPLKSARSYSKAAAASDRNTTPPSARSSDTASSQDTAVIEMAMASGLPLLAPGERNPLHTTTYGTGQLIRAALEDGYRRIIIGIGGSATNDLGLGALSALGVHFRDASGKELIPTGGTLSQICDFETDDFFALAREAKITVMCDITNPLTGPLGAASVFAGQKGASEKEIEILEEGALHICRLIRTKWNAGFARTAGTAAFVPADTPDINAGIISDFSDVPGAGAAGGLGWGLHRFLNARLCSGIDTLIRMYDLDVRLDQVDLVISGEGHADAQSARGKVLSGIGALCRKHNVPLIAIVGGMSMDASALYDCGVTSILTTVNDIMTIESAMHNAEPLMRSAANRLFRLLAACSRSS